MRFSFQQIINNLYKDKTIQSIKEFHWLKLTIVVLTCIPFFGGVPSKAQQQDSIAPLTDTLTTDTTLKTKPIQNPNAIDAPIDYKGDSIITLLEGNKKVLIYYNGIVNYKDIELKANYIEFNLETSNVIAYSITDSTGNRTGIPVFTEGKETFEADTIIYNFKTKKGISKGVISEQSGGYLHGGVVKKHNDGQIHLKDGKYTTCNHEHPHYYFALTKAKVIPKPKNRIISGPLYLVIADIPTPVLLPFGYFPDQGKHSSGILLPSYGEERNRGFYLQNGGYYFNINDYVDLALVGDIYSEGSWGVNARSQYKVRYKFNGNFDIKYSKIITGEKGTPEYSKSNSFWVRWSHSQDAKAWPNSTFSANVNFGSSNYQKYNARNSGDYLSNTFTSSVSYSKRWPGKPFNFTANLNHSQNTQTKNVNLTLPSLSFSMNRQFIADWFRQGKAPPSEKKWYNTVFDKISLNYSANFQNTANAPDSVIFSPDAEFKTGFKHEMPLSASYNLGKFFTLSPSMGYSGRAYTHSIHKEWKEYYYRTGENGEGYLVEDTLITNKKEGIQYAHSISPNFSFSFNPRFYGMYQFKNAEKHRLKAVRHVLTPTVTFSYRPKVGDPDKYYRMVQQDSTGRMQRYSIYEGATYGVPASTSEAGSINFSIDNNLEMKIKSRKDTTDEAKKVKILDRFAINTSYNVFADSMKWSNVSMRGNTRLLDQKINLNFGATFDPYAIDNNGNRINKLLVEQGKSLRLNNANVSASMSLNADTFSDTDDKDKSKSPAAPPTAIPVGMYGYQYVDFNVPWNLSLSYTLNYSKSNFNKEKQQFDYRTTQSLSFSGNLTLTPKWKISFTSGYDFKAKEITYTTFNLHRDLHCWEMSFRWIPLGTRQSYNFQINIISSIFKDLKFKKEKSWYDNLEWE